MGDVPSLIRIDLEAPEPAYRQVADALRALLVSGALPEGARLPTIRELAADLGVHRNTVAQAYRILADEGWLELRRRRGARVVARSVPRPAPRAAERWNRRLEALVAQALAAGLGRREVAAGLRRVLERLEGS